MEACCHVFVQLPRCNLARCISCQKIIYREYISMNKIFAVIVLIWAIVFASACPEKASLEKMQKRSSQIAAAADEGVNITRALFRENLISIEIKDRIADGFIKLARGGQVVDKTIADAIREFGASPPQDARAQIVALFKSNIVSGFLDILDILKIVQAGEKFRPTVEAIKTAVLLIAGSLDIGRETRALIEAKGA